MPATASSRFEYWNGTTWIHEKNVLSIHVRDELHHPMYCEVQISNYGNTGDVDEDANVKENIFREYQKVRVIEGNTGSPLFIGKITKIAPGYDGGLGQQVTVHASGGLLELQSRLVDRTIQYSGNQKVSQIVRDIIKGSTTTIGDSAKENNYVQAHSFAGNINFDGNGLTENAGPETQQVKFKPSDIVGTQGNRKKNLEGAGKNALRVIQSLSANDKDADEDKLGWDFLLDNSFSDAASFVSGTGTIESETISVTGFNTVFTTQLSIGDHIRAVVGGSNEYREIVSIENNTTLTIGHPFSSDISSDVAFLYRIRMVAPTPYFHYFERGYEPGKLPGQGYSGTYGLTLRHQGFGYDVSTLINGAGTVASSGTAVTGSGTGFEAFRVNQRIVTTINSIYEFKTITAIASNTALTIDSAFSVNLGAGSTYAYTDARVIEESDYHRRPVAGSNITYPIRSVRPNFAFPRAYDEIKTRVRTSFQLDDSNKSTSRHQQFDAILVSVYKNSAFTLPKVDEDDDDDVASYSHKPYITWTGTDGASTARVLYCSKAGSQAKQKSLDVDGNGVANKYSGYMLIGPKIVDNDGKAIEDDTWLRQISGQTITFVHGGGSGNDVPAFSSFTAIAHPLLTLDEDGYPEPGSMRELIEQDVEVKLNEYDKTALKDAAEKAAQILYQGGKRTIRGTLNIQKWPYYVITGTNTGTNNSTCNVDSNAALLSRGVYSGGIFYNKGAPNGEKNISATIKINGVTNTSVAGDAQTYMDWETGDIYEIPVLMRAGHAIEVANFPIGSGIKTQDSIIAKIEYDESTGYQEARIETVLFKQSRGWGGNPVRNRTLANALEESAWETDGKTGAVPLSDQSWGAYITFAAVDHDTVQWYGASSGNTGTLKFSKGATYTIAVGNSGNQSNPFVVYFDADVSASVLQVATIGEDIDDYTGPNTVVLAQCIPQSVGGSCEIIADPRVKGFSITTIPASDSVGAALLKKSARPWVTDLAILGTAWNALSWASARVDFSDGTDFLTIAQGTATSISAGTYYLYVDFASSTTGLTLVANNSTMTTAIGDTKILLAIVVVSASTDGTKPLILPFNSKQLTLSAVAIAADSITADHIASGTIQTGNLDFVPVETNNVIASIRASNETLIIEAENIEIGGATTFLSANAADNRANPNRKTTTFTTGSTGSPPTSENVGDTWINPSDSDIYISTAANSTSSWIKKSDARTLAQTADTNATAAVNTANTAATAATAANAELDDIADDAKVTPDEKNVAKRLYTSITSEYSGVLAQGSAQGVSTGNYTTYYNALVTYITSTTSVFSNMTTTTSIARTTWDARWGNYYIYRQVLFNAIAADAETKADTAQGDATTASNTATSAAATAAAAALAVAEKVELFTTSSPPTEANIGDFWIDVNSTTRRCTRAASNLTISDWQLVDNANAINNATTKINGGLIDTQRIRLIEGGSTNPALETAKDTFISTSRILYAVSSTTETEFVITAQSGGAKFVSVGDVLTFSIDGSGNATTEIVYVTEAITEINSPYRQTLTVVRGWLSSTLASLGSVYTVYKHQYLTDIITTPHIIMDNYGITGYSATLGGSFPSNSSGTSFRPQFNIRSEDGKATFGAGTVIADREGLHIQVNTLGVKGVAFETAGGTNVSNLYALSYAYSGGGGSSINTTHLTTASGGFIRLGSEPDYPANSVVTPTKGIMLLSGYIGTHPNGRAAQSGPLWYRFPTSHPTANGQVLARTGTSTVTLEGKSVTTYELGWNLPLNGIGTSSRGVYWSSANAIDNTAFYGTSSQVGSHGSELEPNVYAKALTSHSSSLYHYGIAYGSGSHYLKWSSSNSKMTYATSSERYKENIIDLTIDSSQIYDLVPRNFKWKDTIELVPEDPTALEDQTPEVEKTNVGKNDFGLIAEEVYNIIPELVEFDNQDRPDTVDYPMIGVLLLAEVKKLKERIEALEGNEK